MQVTCPSCLVATQVQSMLRTQSVSMIQFIGPHRNDPTIIVMVDQNLRVEKEPAIRREILCIAGATIIT
jgi:hypothetical protein